jgi:iron uptake system component EfeO
MKNRLVILAAGVSAMGTLAACGDDSAGGNGVAITATDSTCAVATTAFDPGAVTFTVTNKGEKTTEVYVYGEHNGAFTKVIGEVENIGPSLTRNLNVTLTGGRYEIACKPGQTGDGIRTPISVTGATAAAPTAAAPTAAAPTAAAPTAAAYDREVEIEATTTGVEGADGLTGKAGEKIEFKLENKTGAKRELEIIDPSGKVVAEVETDANGTAEAVVTLAAPGPWTLKIEGAGVSEVEKEFTVS